MSFIGGDGSCNLKLQDGRMSTSLESDTKEKRRFFQMEKRIDLLEKRLGIVERFVEIKFCETFRSFTIRTMRDLYGDDDYDYPEEDYDDGEAGNYRGNSRQRSSRKRRRSSNDSSSFHGEVTREQGRIHSIRGTCVSGRPNQREFATSRVYTLVPETATSSKIVNCSCSINEDGDRSPMLITPSVIFPEVVIHEGDAADLANNDRNHDDLSMNVSHDHHLNEGSMEIITADDYVAGNGENNSINHVETFANNSESMHLETEESNSYTPMANSIKQDLSDFKDTIATKAKNGVEEPSHVLLPNENGNNNGEISLLETGIDGDIEQIDNNANVENDEDDDESDSSSNSGSSDVEEVEDENEEGDEEGEKNAVEVKPSIVIETKGLSETKVGDENIVPRTKKRKKKARLTMPSMYAVCKKCGRRVTAKHLRQHQRSIQCQNPELVRKVTGSMPLELQKTNCPRCGKEMLRKSIRRHLRGLGCNPPGFAPPRLSASQSLQPSTSSSSFIQKKSNTPDGLNYRIRKVTCGRCGKVVLQKSLGRHMKTTSCLEGDSVPSTSVSTDAAALKKETNENQDVGDLDMDDEDGVAQMRQLNVNDEDTEPIVDISEYDCKYADCGCLNDTREQYEEHLKIHPLDTGFPCPVCNTQYLSKLNMEEHLSGHKQWIIRSSSTGNPSTNTENAVAPETTYDTSNNNLTNTSYGLRGTRESREEMMEKVCKKINT